MEPYIALESEILLNLNMEVKEASLLAGGSEGGALRTSPSGALPRTPPKDESFGILHRAASEILLIRMKRLFE